MENQTWPECSCCGEDTEPLKSINKDEVVCDCCYDQEMFKRLDFINPEVDYLGMNEEGEHLISFKMVARDRELLDSDQRGIVFKIREGQLYPCFDSEKHEVPVYRSKCCD